MSKRIPLGIVVALLLAAVLCSSFISINYVVNKNNQLLVDLPARADQYSDLAEIEEIVRREYFGEMDSDVVDRSLAEGFLSGLGDSFCYYIAAEDFDAYTNLVSGKVSGIGISVYYEKETDNLVISNIEQGSPADNAGFEINNQIISVNGKNVSGENYEELIAEISDSYDTKLKLVYVKSAEDKKDQHSEAEVKSGYSQLSCFKSVENGIGYIRIVNFFDTTVGEFVEIMNNFIQDGISDIVIDLRNSSGTNLDVAAEMIDFIVPVGNEGTGAIFTARNSEGAIVKQASSDADSLSCNIALLTNRGTECAAELLACDLRDFGKAVIVGEKTSGHGSLQELFRLEDGSAITLTVAEIIPYTSDSFNGVGIEPDLLVEVADGFYNNLNSIALSDDPQFQAAATFLKAK